MSSVLTESLTDLKIPTLQAVLDPCELGKYLSPILAPDWGVLRDIEIQVLQHHRASRCTVDIKLLTTTGSYELVGKVYAKDRSDVYRAMNQIIQSGFGPEEEFSIPQPFAFIPQLYLLLQEKIQGPLVTDIFLTGDVLERARAAHRCGRWLAHFHAQAPMSGPVFVFTPELMESCVRRLAKRAGKQGRSLDKAVLLCQRLERAAAALDHVEMRASNGDSCHQNMILAGARTVTIDWDGYCLADPGRDVARFIIALRQLALKSQGSLRALDADIEIFYTTYAIRSSFDVAKHLHFYQAAHCLKHAKHHLKPGNGGAEMTEAMLDEGLRILAEEM